jgi:hypothetical protein
MYHFIIINNNIPKHIYSNTDATNVISNINEFLSKYTITNFYVQHDSSNGLHNIFKWILSDTSVAFLSTDIEDIDDVKFDLTNTFIFSLLFKEDIYEKFMMTGYPYEKNLDSIINHQDFRQIIIRYSDLSDPFELLPFLLKDITVHDLQQDVVYMLNGFIDMYDKSKGNEISVTTTHDLIKKINEHVFKGIIHPNIYDIVMKYVNIKSLTMLKIRLVNYEPVNL